MCVCVCVCVLLYYCSSQLDHDVGDKEKAAVKEGGAGRSAGGGTKKKKERLKSLDTFRG